MAIPKLNEFKTIKLLGEGSFGAVFEVVKLTEPKQNKKFAIKRVNKAKTGIQLVMAERKILEMVNENQWCIEMLYAFSTRNYAYFIFEIDCN